MKRIPVRLRLPVLLALALPLIACTEPRRTGIVFDTGFDTGITPSCGSDPGVSTELANVYVGNTETVNIIMSVYTDPSKLELTPSGTATATWQNSGPSYKHPFAIGCTGAGVGAVAVSYFPYPESTACVAVVDVNCTGAPDAGPMPPDASTPPAPDASTPPAPDAAPESPDAGLDDEDDGSASDDCQVGGRGGSSSAALVLVMLGLFFRRRRSRP